MTALLLVFVLGSVPDAAGAEVSDAGARGDVDASPDAGVSPDARAADAFLAPVDARLVSFGGRVWAKGTREPLAGASITIDAEAAGEASEDGRFSFQVRPGRRRVQIQHPGYEPLDVAVEAGAPGADGDRAFRLMPRLTGERYETVVTAPDERAPSTSLANEELTRVPGSVGDPFRVIESLPGVSQVVWPLALYAIRGANPGNTGFFLDGVRVPSLFHFALGPSAIHPFFLESLEFYPGGYPVRYGRYVSGIVAARTKTPETERVRGMADVRLYDSGGIVVAPWNEGKGSVAVAGRFSYTGLLVSQFAENYAVSYWDYQVRTSHRLGPGKLTLFVFGSGDSLRLGKEGANEPFGGTGGGSADLAFHRADLRWDGSLFGGKLEVAVLGGWDDSATSLRDLVAAGPISTTMLSAAPRLSFQRALSSWADLELGADAEWQRFRPESVLPEAQAQDIFVDRVVLSGGAFAGLTLRAGSRLTIAPGIRYDLYVEQGVQKFEPGPRLTVRARAWRDLWIKVTGGRFSQMASLPVAVPGFEGFGLKTYGTQTSSQGSVGVESPLAGSFSFDVTAFYQRLRLTDLKSMFTYDPQVELLEMRDGQSYGLEIMIRRAQSERLFGWLSYTLSKSERLIGAYLVRAASDWDQRHVLNLVVGRRLSRGYSVGARVHLNTGRPYPVVDEGTFRVDYQRLPTFYQLDLRADKRFIFDRYLLDVYIELVNSTLTRQVFDIKKRQDGAVEVIQGRFPLPSIGVHAEW